MKPLKSKKKLHNILVKFAAKLSAMPNKSWDEVADIMIKEIDKMEVQNGGNHSTDDVSGVRGAESELKNQ